MARMKILVSGGGIAGTSVAFWLSKLGHDVTVVERFPCLRATGLQIDLRGHGIEVLKLMGLEQAFRSRSVPEQGLQIVDKSGRRRAFFPASTSSQGTQNFTSEFEIMRGDLCRLLYDATKDRVTYVFGTSIESFEEKGGSVDVRFADGKTGRFDLLVGADGQGSRTRKMMLGPNAKDPFYPVGGGQYVAYFTLSRHIQEGEGYMATMYRTTQHRGMMTRRHSPELMQVYLGCKANSNRLKNASQGDVKEEKEALIEIFKGAGWKTGEILESIHGADDFYGDVIGLIKLESWSRGCVTLVGDAGYCPSVNTGMGTTSAIVGAYVLAGEIGKHCRHDNSDYSGKKSHVDDSLVTALKEYERQFRPFMDQVQKGETEASSFDAIWSTSFGIAILNYLLGAASLLKVNIAKWVIKENVKGWDLPEYEEMV